MRWLELADQAPVVLNVSDYNEGCIVQLQVELYQHVLRGKTIAVLMSARSDEPSEGVLGVITTLRKLCNHPTLLRSSSGTPQFALALPAFQQVVRLPCSIALKAFLQTGDEFCCFCVLSKHPIGRADLLRG